MEVNANKSEIVAVIPCYNEQETIHVLVLEALKYVDSVVVVNDGSQDNTEEKATRAGALVINHQNNRGKGVALETASQYLRKLDCKAVVFLDGDGQHDPAEIPRVIEPVLGGKADMVIGSRFIEGSHKIPGYRKIGQIILNYATNRGSGVWVTDSQSGFRSFSYQAINKMKFKEKGFSVESEMQFIAGRHGLKVVEVPISTIYNRKLKRNPVVHGFSVLLRVLRLLLYQPINQIHLSKYE